MSKKIKKVALLYGGFSEEREISIKSGKAVEKALEKLGYEYGVFDPIEKEKFIFKLKEFNPDICFIALHGKGGEDGQIQSVLDFLGIAYTGSNAKTSAICMDKKLTKDILASNKIPVPKEYSLDNVNFPAVVKPSEEGSSIGVYIVKNKNQLKEALDKLSKYDNIVIEQFINGRELTVSVLNDRILPIIEIKVKNGFYDFKNKYVSKNTEYICPAEIPFVIEQKIHSIVLKIKKILNLKGAFRVDIILHNNIPYVLEINTIPGLTDHSLLPKAAKQIRINFEKLIDEIIKGVAFEK